MEIYEESLKNAVWKLLEDTTVKNAYWKVISLLGKES